MTRTVIAIFFAVSVCAFAGEKRNFYGSWEPPQSLLVFWAPIDDSWWSAGSTPKLDRRCREFARRWKAETIIPDMIADLRANPAEVRWFVYLDVMLNWPKKRVLRILAPFQHSPDPAIAHIADEFTADIE